MATLTDFLTELSNKLRTRLNTVDSINASQFATKIDDVYNKSTLDFWKILQGGTNGSGIAVRKAYNQCFMNWNTISIKPGYPVIDAAPDIRYMFYNNGALLEIDFTSWTWAASTTSNMSYSFYGCRNLQTIDIGNNFKGVQPIDISNMFNGCTALETISNFDISLVQSGKATDTFKNCSKLREIQFAKDINDNYKRINFSGLSFVDCPLLSPNAMHIISLIMGNDSPGVTKTITFNTANRQALCDYENLDIGYWSNWVSEKAAIGWDVYPKA